MSLIRLDATPIDGYKEVLKHLNRLERLKFDSMVRQYAETGLDRLRQATPVDTGLAESSWRYEIENNGSTTTITWCNDDIEGGYSVVMLIEYGHGVKGGGYVNGRHFIADSMDGIFEEFVTELWEAIKS